MDKPIRIQLSRRKGFRMQAQSPDGREVVKVARPTKWGNPFKVGEEYVRRRMKPGGGENANYVGDNAAAVRLYKRYTAREMDLQISAYQELRGKHLACFCSLDELCHADVLLKIANQELENRP